MFSGCDYLKSVVASRYMNLKRFEDFHRMVEKFERAGRLDEVFEACEPHMPHSIYEHGDLSCMELVILWLEHRYRMTFQ